MIRVSFDDECTEQGRNIKNIVDQSHLADIEKDLEFNINIDDILFINHEINPPSRVRITEAENKKDSSLIYKLFPKKNAKILDCTGGFGKDAMEFYKLGYSVTMIEENPLVVFMLKSFFEKNKEIKIDLKYGNSLDYLRLNADSFDYIFIDTMFEKVKNKSKSKKEIEILQYICRERVTRLNLIKEAQKESCKRVIIKESPKSHFKYDFDYSIKTKLVSYNILKGKM